ncbi:MAG: HAMP domain-containing protein [Legionella sp.]|nr:HAMP domain-containing protein [Legionella sp.]
MRSLYWKIFLSFWLATILVILTIAWVTSEITKKSSLPAHEYLFMDSYANAAVSTFELGQHTALKRWLKQTGASRQMFFFLLSSRGEIIGNQTPPDVVRKISKDLMYGQLDDRLIKFGNTMVSHEILSTSGRAYRLVAVSEKPLAYFVKIPWTDLALRLAAAILICGLICYFLSIYLTRPLRSLRIAAKSIAKGNLSTRVGHFMGHSRDEIGELSNEFDRMAAELEVLVNSKERLLQDISHELRSPLARLQVALELAKRKLGNDHDFEFDRMEIECTRLNHLIQEVLEFARLEHSTARLHKKWTNVSHLLEQIIEDANFELGATVPAVFLHGAELACPLFVDERLLHRAIENIIRNSLRYAAPSPRINIFLRRDNIQGEVCIEIQDNGPGVPEDQLRQIFSPFYRTDSARTKETGGYGLGLSIAWRAIYLHQGELTAMNRPEGGLSVRIRLPLTTSG